MANIPFLNNAYFSAKVGIGTDSPDIKLEISEPSQNLPTLGVASGNLLLSDNGPWGMHFGLDTNVGTGWIQQMRNDSAVAYNLLLQPVGGNVGIGTDSPNEKLHVKGGTTNVVANFESTDAKAYISFKDNTTTNTDTVFLGAEGNNMTFYAGSASSERMRIQSDGNVGIGTDSPSVKLHVSENSSTYIKIERTTSSSEGSLILGAETNENTIFSRGLGNANKDLRVIIGATERMRIDSTGNVGIGTVSPTLAKLQVNGTVDNQIAAYFYNYSTVAGQSKGLAVEAGSNSSDYSATFNNKTGSSLLYVRGDGNVGIGTNSPDNILELSKTVSSGIGPILQLTNTQYTNADNSGSSIQFRGYKAFGPGSTNPRYSEINAINGSGSVPKRIEFKFYADTDVKTPLAILQTGNVGIGTDSPLGKLQVTLPAYTNEDTNSQQAIFGVDSGYGVRVGYNETDNKGYINVLQPAVAWGDLVLQSGGGNVGIGTDSPDTLLNLESVSPIIRLESNDNSIVSNQVIGGIEMKSIDPSGLGVGVKTSIKAISESSIGSRFGLAFSTTNFEGVSETEAMRIDSSGNVGIGTISPDAKLDIEAATNPTIRLTNSTNPLGAADVGTLEFFTKDTSTGASRVLSSIVCVNEANSPAVPDGQLVFKTSLGGAGANPATEKMRIDPVGNVGIGTVSPSAKLEIFGTGNSLRLDSSANGSKEILFRNVGTGIATIKTDGDLKLFAEDAGKNILFNNNGGERMRINSAGNVGIGTTSPNAKLEVDIPTYSANNAIANFVNGFNPVRVVYDTVVVAQQDVPCLSIIETPSGAQSSEQKLTLSAGDGRVVIGSSSTASDGIYINTNRATNTPGYNHTAGNNVARFLNNGNAIFTNNVGIGTTSPSAKLNISGTGTGGAIDWTNTTATTGRSYRWVSINTGGFAIEDLTASGAKRMVIDPVGNVGIGTDSPSEKLTVSGGSSGYMTTIENTTAGGDYLQMIGDAGSPVFQFDSGGTGGEAYFSMYKDNVKKILLDANVGVSYINAGNVGIGTTSPNEKLDVAGKVYIEGNGQDWNETTPGTTRGSIHFDPGTTANNAGNAITFGASDAFAGTNSHAGIYTRSDGNYGTKMYLATTDSYATGSKTRMMIDYNGNVGIGNISPDDKLEVSGSASGYPSIKISNPSQTGRYMRIGMIDSVNHCIEANGGAFLTFKTGNTEAMRIDNLGNVGIGETNPGAKLDIVSTTGTSSSNLLKIKSTTAFLSAPGHMIDFIRSNNTIRGFVGMNQYGVSYSTSSDYRLKRNIVSIADGIDRVKKLKPSRFNWDDGPDDYFVDGFVAHEVGEVIPEAITGEKDAVDKYNAPIYQGIDQSKIVPLLTAALQQAIDKIEQLELRINKLEKQ